VWVVPNIWKEHVTFIFSVQQFKNARNILPTALHHIPVKLNHQQHCSDKLTSHTMYTFWGTRICYHVMACLPLDLYSGIYEYILHLHKILHSDTWWAYVSAFYFWWYLINSLWVNVFPYMCYDTFILPHIMSLFVTTVHMMNLHM
jgi:hypothetical protein